MQQQYLNGGKNTISDIFMGAPRAHGSDRDSECRNRLDTMLYSDRLIEILITGQMTQVACGKCEHGI